MTKQRETWAWRKRGCKNDCKRVGRRKPWYCERLQRLCILTIVQFSLRPFANSHGEILKIIVPGQKKRFNQRLIKNNGKFWEDFMSNELEKEKNGAYNKNEEINRIKCLKMLLSVSPAFMELRFNKNNIGENMEECFRQVLTKLINESYDPRKDPFMELLRPMMFYLTEWLSYTAKEDQLLSYIFIVFLCYLFWVCAFWCICFDVF